MPDLTYSQIVHRLQQINNPTVAEWTRLSETKNLLIQVQAKLRQNAQNAAAVRADNAAEQAFQNQEGEMRREDRRDDGAQARWAQEEARMLEETNKKLDAVEGRMSTIENRLLPLVGVAGLVEQVRTADTVEAAIAATHALQAEVANKPEFAALQAVCEQNLHNYEQCLSTAPRPEPKPGAHGVEEEAGHAFPQDFDREGPIQELNAGINQIVQETCPAEPVEGVAAVRQSLGQMLPSVAPAASTASEGMDNTITPQVADTGMQGPGMQSSR